MYTRSTRANTHVNEKVTRFDNVDHPRGGRKRTSGRVTSRAGGFQGEALVTDYCATEAVGSKELRKMRKLSQLLEHTALSGDTMRKAEHKILQLRSELLSCVEHAARGNGDAFDGLKLLCASLNSAS